MKNISALMLLKSLKEDEIDEFKDFILSPFFNKNKKIIALFEIIIKDKKNRFFTKEQLYAKLYPDKKYNYGIMNNLLYELNKLGEKYLEYKRLSIFKIDKQIYKMHELLIRNLNHALERNIRETEILLESNSKTDSYFYDKLNLETIKNNYYIKHNPKKENFNFAKDSNEFLISYFLIKFFRINYNNMIQKYNFEILENLDFIEGLLNYAENNKFKFEAVIKLYYFMFMSIYKPENEIYFDKMELLIKNTEITLNRTELFNIYITLCNYCQKKINEGINKYKEKLFNLYEEMLKKGLFNYEDNNTIHHRLFRNVIKSSIDLKKFNWTEKFINEYSLKLESEIRNNEILFSKSIILFAKGKYYESMAELSKVKFDSVIDKPLYYVLECKIYYETKDFDILETCIDKFVHFLRYDKLISKEIKIKYKNFLKLITELIKLKLAIIDNNNYSRMILKSKIDELETPEKDWLLEKINDI